MTDVPPNNPSPGFTSSEQQIQNISEKNSPHPTPHTLGRSSRAPLPQPITFDKDARSKYNISESRLG